MKNLSILLLFVLLVALTGCPYEANSPLDDGSYSVPTWLVGKWKEQSSDGKIYEIGKSTDKGIFLAYESDSTGHKTGELKKVILSKLDDKVYANVYTDGDDMNPKGYYIYQFRIINEIEIDMMPLRENREITELDALRNFLQRNGDNEDVFYPLELMKFRKF